MNLKNKQNLLAKLKTKVKNKPTDLVFSVLKVNRSPSSPYRNNM